MNTRPKSKTDYIHIRTTPQLKEVAKELAKLEAISMSDLIAKSLRTYARVKYAPAKAG